MFNSLWTIWIMERLNYEIILEIIKFKLVKKKFAKFSIGNFKWGIGRENFIKLVLNNVFSQLSFKKSWSGLIDVQKKSGCKINSKLSLNFKWNSSDLFGFKPSNFLDLKEFHLNNIRKGNISLGFWRIVFSRLKLSSFLGFQLDAAINQTVPSWKWVS